MKWKKRRDQKRSYSWNWRRRRGSDGRVSWSGSPCCLQMWKRCFSRAEFLIALQSGRTHPQLFSVIKKQIMAEWQGNFQIITGVAEIVIGPHSRPSFCWWQYISVHSWNLKYSSILSAGDYYSSPLSYEDSIPQSVCWTWRQQRVAQSQWTAAFFFLSSVFHSHAFLSTALLSLSKW